MMTTEMAMETKSRVLANSGEHFIVRVAEKHFFLCFGDNRSDVRGTLVLSEAAHLTYRDADVLVQALRAQGYDAIAADRYGNAVTEESLRTVDEPSIPMSLIEYQSIPAPVMKRRYYSEPKFRERLDAAIKQGIVKPVAF
jgi:hypothetical protein